MLFCLRHAEMSSKCVQHGVVDKVQGAAYEGVKLDGAAAADHTAALYCAINETLERLASKKMYKSGATTLRDSVDRALLMCSQLESGTGCAMLVGSYSNSVVMGDV
jgi:hypothetical protein